MNDSQSSDVFSVSTEFSSSSQLAPFNQMDTIQYESLVTNTKRCLVIPTRETFEQFTFLLSDCSVCVNKALKLIETKIEEPYVEISKLTGYLEDSMSIIHLLSNIMKSMVESMTASCSSMKTLPTVTGQLILTIFTHCKDSENIYGSYLCDVEANLKNLFRTCHELQVTYLMVLEKHFIIDLAETGENNILLEALDINLQIGEVVQSLDVKTMAEQWKSFTAVCEKYSSYLNDTHIYNKSVQVLCEIITNNFSNARENDKDEKLVLRSLKVASFTIKILMKICIIFKKSSMKEPECIVELLILFHLHSVIETENSSNFCNLLNTYVLTPLENLIYELVSDTAFVNKLLQFNSSDTFTEEKLLGFILVIICVMKSLVHKRDQHNVPKCQIIDCVYTFLPYCHNLFYKKFKFKTPNDNQTFGVYEHLLIHTVEFASTLDREEYTHLEGKMYEAIMGIDCYRALFSSDLWTLLGRISKRQLLLDQLMFLCKNYQKLDGHYLFYDSPQRIHVSCTIRKLFKILSEEEKVKFCQKITIFDETNRNLLKVIEVRNLPLIIRDTLEADIIEDCKIALHKLVTSSMRTPEEMDELIMKLNLTATCNIIQEDSISDYLIKAWRMTCNKNKIISNDYRNTTWFSKFIEALLLVTKILERACYSGPNGLKVLHCITTLIETASADTKILLIDTICTVICFSNNIENLFPEDILKIFKNLLFESDAHLKNSFLLSLKQNITNQNVKKLLNKIFNKHNELREIWNSFENSNDSIDSEMGEKCTLNKFIHKCSENVIENNSKEHDVISISSAEKKRSSNFDLADIDSLFESEVDSEPESKKIKLDNEIEQIVGRLERNAYLLCNYKENTIEYRKRIQIVCDKLLNVIK